MGRHQPGVLEMRVQFPRGPLDTPVVKRTSQLFPKGQVQVRLLAEVLVGEEYPRGVPAACDRAKVEGEVRLLTGMVARTGRMVGMV